MRLNGPEYLETRDTPAHVACFYPHGMPAVAQVIPLHYCQTPIAHVCPPTVVLAPPCVHLAPCVHPVLISEHSHP